MNYSKIEKKVQEDISVKFYLHASVFTHVGCKRPNNEDNFLLNQTYNVDSVLEMSETISITNPILKWHCAGVFDGMGGGENGELASRMASEEFQKIAEEMNTETLESDIDNMMRQAFLNANRRIVEEQLFHAMYGTTGTVVCTNGKNFKVFHLGDSRAYLWREETLYQITQDQTLAQLKISAGFYEADDPLVEKEKHQLTEYIGRDMTMEHLAPLESEWLELLPNDKILLCSDGLYDMCSDTEINDIIKKNNSIEEITKQLVTLALEHGGIDNITCLLLEIEKNIKKI